MARSPPVGRWAKAPSKRPVGWLRVSIIQFKHPLRTNTHLESISAPLPKADHEVASEHMPVKSFLLQRPTDKPSYIELMRDRIIALGLIAALVSCMLLSCHADQGVTGISLTQPRETSQLTQASQTDLMASVAIPARAVASATVTATATPPGHPAATEIALTPMVYAPLIQRDLTPTPEPTALPTIVPSVTLTPSLSVSSVHGLSMDSIFRAPDLIQQAGTTWLRGPVLKWLDVEPTEGTRNWSANADLERQMIEASKRNITLIMIVLGTPSWARKYPQSSCGPIRPDKLNAFAGFMSDVVKRYSAPPYNIQYWEIWNEPDAPVSTAPGQGWGCWGETSDTYYGARFYADMLKVAYPRMKAANRDIKIMLGGLLANCDPVNPPSTRNCQQSKWFEGLLVNGAGPYFDGLSFHTYDYFYNVTGVFGSDNWHSAWDTTGPLLVIKGRYLKNLMAARGVTGKFIIDTELAVLCSGCQNSTSYETTKAHYIAKAYAAAMAEGYLAAIWYSVDGWLGTALLDTNNLPKPGFIAFRVSRAKLGGASYAGDITSADTGVTGVKGYKFTRDGVDVWILWSQNAVSHIITLGKKPAAITDVLGASFSPTSTFAVTFAPVYVEWPTTTQRAQ